MNLVSRAKSQPQLH